MKLPALKLIIFLLSSVAVHGQLRHTSHYLSKTGWLCSESIILDSAGFFFKASGCEGDQHVSFGKYRILKDGRFSVKFLPLDSIVPIREIKQTTPTKDSFITVRLFDRENQPVPAGFQIQAIDTSGKAVEIWPLSNGSLVINRFQYKQLFLEQLALVYTDVAPVLIGDHSIDIYFNLPSMFIMYSGTKRGEAFPIRLIVKADGLYNSKTKQKEYELSN